MVFPGGNQTPNPARSSECYFFHLNYSAHSRERQQADPRQPPARSPAAHSEFVVPPSGGIRTAPRPTPRSPQTNETNGRALSQAPLQPNV